MRTYQWRAVSDVCIPQGDPGCEQPRGSAAHKDAVRVQACTGGQGLGIGVYAQTRNSA